MTGKQRYQRNASLSAITYVTYIHNTCDVSESSSFCFVWIPAHIEISDRISLNVVPTGSTAASIFNEFDLETKKRVLESFDGVNTLEAVRATR